MNAMEAKTVKPLEKLRIKVFGDNDMEKEIPALSRHWWMKRETIYYVPPPALQSKEIFAKENWLTGMEVYIEELEWLLSLEFHRFWSQIVYDDQVLNEIRSFLQEGTPFYMLNKFPRDDNLWEMYKKIHKHVFMLVSRLTTFVESDSEFMTPEFYAKLVYEKYIITIPMLLDVCLLYGKENRAGVSNIIHQTFQLQPKYKKDLKKTIPLLRKVLKYVEERFGGQEHHHGDPAKLADRTDDQKQMTLHHFQDLILNVLDTSINISMFLDIYPPACGIFHESLFELKVAHFYENTIPKMYNKLNLLASKEDSQDVFEEATSRLAIIRLELLKIFRYCLASCVTAVLENSEHLKEGEVKKIVDDYVNVLSECLSEVIFIRDYHSTYPVEVDLDVLSQVCPEMDSVKRDFILESVLACFDFPKSSASQHRRPSIVDKVTQNAQSSLAEDTANAPVNAATEDGMIVKKRKPVKGVELDSLISEVKDILPHLGEGFIEKCLEHFNFNTEAVISGVLEGTLPEEFKSLDFALERTLNDTDEATNGIERLNVFDNDEFDIMTQDEVDTSRIHKGKRKSEYKNLNQLIDDKGHRDELREMYSKLGLVEDSERMYDDEYDDTYDAVDVSVEEGDIEGRPFVVPRVLQGKQVVSSDSESETEEVEDTSSEAARDAFVQNPEELRARAEQRRQLKQQQRHRNFPPRSNDVVGREKGKGQDKQTVHNRDRKTVHKSTYANHNRRAGAQRKKQQSMLGV